METTYEYRIVVHTGKLAEVADWATLSQDEMSRILAAPLGRIADTLAEALPKLPPGDWEAVSHDLAIYGQAIILTFLVRRLQ